MVIATNVAMSGRAGEVIHTGVNSIVAMNVLNENNCVRNEEALTVNAQEPCDCADPEINPVGVNDVPGGRTPDSNKYVLA